MKKPDIGQIITEIKKGNGNFPSCFNFLSNRQNLIVGLSDDKKSEKKHIRGLDVWALAAFSFLTKDKKKDFKKIILKIKGKNDIEIEALKRRVSFLKVNNKDIVAFDISLEVNGNNITLYDIHTLFERPKEEILRPAKEYKQRNKSNTSTGLEKMLQEYLFDTKTEKGHRTNERLAIFGTDFYNLKGKGYCMTREFPTGVFNTTVSGNTRILPSESVDFISVNKNKELAVIELKVNDSQLEVISQALNYILFFAAYKKELSPILKQFEITSNENSLIKCYIVANKLHPKFDFVKSFYIVKDKKKIPFEIVPTLLGHYVGMQLNEVK